MKPLENSSKWIESVSNSAKTNWLLLMIFLPNNGQKDSWKSPSDREERASVRAPRSSS